MRKIRWGWVLVMILFTVAFVWIVKTDAQEKPPAGTPQVLTQVSVDLTKLNDQVKQWNSRIEDIEKTVTALDTEKKQLQGAVYALTSQIKTLLVVPDSVKAKMSKAAEKK